MITKEMLENAYIQEEKSMKECAEYFGISVGTVFNYIKKYGIESRPRMTDKIKWKISNTKLGKPNNRKNFRHSDESKKKISDAHKGIFFKPSKYGGHRKKRSDG